MNLRELREYVKTISYDELMKMLAIILHETTKRAAEEALKE